MMKEEFEQLVGRTFTSEQYYAINDMYMTSSLDKETFARRIKPIVLTFPEVERTKIIRKVNIPNAYGYTKTPNRCYYFIKYVELVDVDIASGKYVVKDLSEADIKKLKHSGVDIHYSSSYDFSYENCILSDKTPLVPERRY